MPDHAAAPRPETEDEVQRLLGPDVFSPRAIDPNGNEYAYDLRPARERLRVLLAERQQLREALEAIMGNAKAWHGIEGGPGAGHARALRIIGEWADAALAAPRDPSPDAVRDESGRPQGNPPPAGIADALPEQGGTEPASLAAASPRDPSQGTGCTPLAEGTPQVGTGRGQGASVPHDPAPASPRDSSQDRETANG